MHNEHFDGLLALLDIERDAERAENERKLEKMPVQAREALGKTVTRLVISREDFGVGAQVLWVLSRPSHGEEYSPFQALNQGDLVSLSFQDPPFRRSVERSTMWTNTRLLYRWMGRRHFKRPLKANASSMS